MQILDTGMDTDTLIIEINGSDSQELKRIITEHLPAWAHLFASKNSEYGSGSAFELGERGQFSDMYRKMIKLKRAMWDEDESVLTTEGVDEIISDLIGHCFLTLEMRRRARSAANNTAYEGEGYETDGAGPHVHAIGLQATATNLVDMLNQAIETADEDPEQDDRHKIVQMGDPVEIKANGAHGRVVQVVAGRPNARNIQVRPEVSDPDAGQAPVAPWFHVSELEVRYGEK